jgi:hypothetical protein
MFAKVSGNDAKVSGSVSKSACKSAEISGLAISGLAKVKKN